MRAETGEPSKEQEFARIRIRSQGNDGRKRKSRREPALSLDSSEARAYSNSKTMTAPGDPEGK